MDKFFTGLGISLIVFGSILVFQRNNPNRIAFAYSQDYQIDSVTPKKNLPSRIEIPSLEINLPIFTSKITNNKWEVSDNGVSYLEQSPIPGQLGNSIIYGHNWTNLLGNLIKIETGEKINIYYKDGSQKEFIVSLIQEVKSNDVSVLRDTKDTRITLYTCSGFLDSKRFVVVAKLLY